MVLLTSFSLAAACSQTSKEGSGNSGTSDVEQSESLSDSEGDSVSEDPPAKDDPVSLGAEQIGAIPSSTMKVSASVGGNTAEASWFVKYGETGLEFEVYVSDANIYSKGSVYANDGIEALIAKTSRTEGYTDGTISVIVDAAGTVKVTNKKTNTEVKDSGITATVKTFTLENKTVDGYKVTFTVPYTVTEVSKDGKDAALSLGVTNANSAADSKTVYGNAFGENYENVHTYAALTADDTWTKNPCYELGMVWGDGGSKLKKSSVWDISNDDGAADASIAMTGCDDKDNTVYMHQTGSLTNYYAEVKINVSSKSLNGEKWGKFGLTIVNANNDAGALFYVDAAAADGENFNGDAVALGYNTGVPSGWDGNWSSIGSLGGTSAQYQGDNYVTLGIYRQGNLFSLYANGNFVKTVTPGIGADEEAYIGLACFNMTLAVKEYSVKTTGLEDYEITTQEVDYLFLGDSYIDTAFWYTYNEMFDDYAAANVGVGGTKTAYWQEQLDSLKYMYDAENIVMHIGVNDIDDGNTTGETTITRLTTLIEAYSEAFPDATIYYVGLVHNMMFPAKWAEYDKVNAYMSNWAETEENLVYIDMAQYITANADGSTMSWFNADGLHYGVDGYAVFNREICKALGISRTTSENGLGDLNSTVDGAPSWAYSAGWKYDSVEKAWVNYGDGEAQLFINGAYGTDLYAETKLSIAGNTASDAYPKAGLAIRTQSETYFWFIDLATSLNANGTYYTNRWSNVVYRADTMQRDWDWSTIWGAGSYKYLGDTSMDYNNDHSYITMGIAKLGDTIYCVANGNVIGTLEGKFAADEAVAISVFDFNMKVYTKDGYVTTDATEVQRVLLADRSVSLGDYDGVTANFSTTTAKAGDKVTFTLDAGDKMLDTVSVNGTPVTADNGVYSFTMPDADVVVTLTFKGLFTVTVDSGLTGQLTASKTTAYDGENITLQATDSYVIDKLYLNGVELMPDDNGDYVFELTENTTVTGTLYYTVDGVVLDGEVDDAYGSTYTKAEYTDNRDVTVYAVKTKSGLFVYAIAHMNTIKTDSGAWYNNTNMEIWLNSVQHHVNVNGDLGNVSHAYWITNAPETEEDKYEYVLEAFIAKDMVTGWTDEGSVQLNYGWKTEGETGYTIGDVIHAYALDWNHDWLAGHSGGVNVGANDFATGFGTYGTYSDKLQITQSGLQVGEAAADAKIDGDLSEYGEKTSVTVGDANKAQFAVSGFAGSDGLYLALTITHGNWSSLTTGNWAGNDNIELRINGGNVAILFLNGKLSVPDFFDKGAAVTTEADGKLVTTVELFAACAAPTYKLQMGCAGSGFGGWQALIWDGNAVYVTANGVGSENPAKAPAALDGVFDDTVWTSDVLAKSFSTDVNGAKLTMVGVNLKEGVMLGFTVVHSKSVDTVIQGNGNEWWNYMGPEFRLGGLKDSQLAVTTWNSNAIGELQFGYKTVDNGNGTYTTTYEVFAPHHVTCSSVDDNVKLAVGGVFETGFSWLFGGDNANPVHYVTVNGIIAK